MHLEAHVALMPLWAGGGLILYALSGQHVNTSNSEHNCGCVIPLLAPHRAWTPVDDSVNLPDMDLSSKPTQDLPTQ
jgi:hypothetical protein